MSALLALVDVNEVMEENMYEYDVRNQIKTENKSKLFGEASIMAIVLAAIICIMYTVRIDNPFGIDSPKMDKEISDMYEKGDRYISLDSVDLSYTGYYKEDKEGNAIYNCYKLTMDELAYFVFVPLERSGENLENPEVLLSDYSLEGKLRKDEALLEIVSKDYNSDMDTFMKEYHVSSIMIDEARNDRGQVMLVWGLFALLLLGYIIYIVWSLSRAGNPKNRREIRKLGEKEELDTILDEINKEVSKQKQFDTNRVKITDNWFLAFYDGNIVITSRNKIYSVRGIEKVKKAYGIAKIGFRSFIEIVLENGFTYEIPIEESKDYEEILEIFKDFDNRQNA